MKFLRGLTFIQIRHILKFFIENSLKSVTIFIRGTACFLLQKELISRYIERYSQTIMSFVLIVMISIISNRLVIDQILLNMNEISSIAIVSVMTMA